MTQDSSGEQSETIRGRLRGRLKALFAVTLAVASLGVGLTLATSPAKASANYVLYGGQALSPGQRLVSRYKAPGIYHYHFVFQTDGNLVLYGNEGHPSACWASNTLGRGDTFFVQTDGNLVVYKRGVKTWASNTAQPRSHHYKDYFRLLLQEDGNVVLYRDRRYNDGRWYTDPIWVQYGCKHA